MKKIDLIKVEHTAKIGDFCPYYEPNITEDSLFYENGVLIGFYIKKMPERMIKLAEIANNEFRSKSVPKSAMNRKPTDGIDEKTGKYKYKNTVTQMSTIIGSIPPKPHMKRPYPSRSSVHQVKSAQTFIKAMLILANEAEHLIKEICPEIHELQASIFEKVPKEWRFGNIWTSSISNFNIAAAFHRDAANIENCVNVIITKRENAQGGNLHVPDYGATMDSADNSILVYPAWKNVHGVTPIIPTKEGGYRNSLVFYPLKAFLGLK